MNITGKVTGIFVEPLRCSITLDSCINNLYNNIPGSSGAPPVIPNTFIPSLDFSKALNSQNVCVVMA